MVDLKDERRRSKERRSARGEAVAEEHVLDPGPTGEVLAERRAAALTPFVQQVRLRAFGSESAPFQPGSEDVEEWLGQELANWLKGVPVSASYQIVRKAAESIAPATGFSVEDARDWILTGQPPRLPRAVLSLPAVKNRFNAGPPAGEVVVQRAYATLTINAPISESEYRRFWSKINRMWSEPDRAEGVRRALYRRHGRAVKLSEADKTILALVEAAPDATWKDRVEQLRLNPPPGLRVDKWRNPVNVLTTRYRRALRKRDQLEGGSHG